MMIQPLTYTQAAYQGSNPISDIFSKWALETTVKYLPRIARDAQGDEEARSQMLWVCFSFFQLTRQSGRIDRWYRLWECWCTHLRTCFATNDTSRLISSTI